MGAGGHRHLPAWRWSARPRVGIKRAQRSSMTHCAAAQGSRRAALSALITRPLPPTQVEALQQQLSFVHAGDVCKELHRGGECCCRTSTSCIGN